MEAILASNYLVVDAAAVTICGFVQEASAALTDARGAARAIVGGHGGNRCGIRYQYAQQLVRAKARLSARMQNLVAAPLVGINTGSARRFLDRGIIGE
ncbi:hypothetical protein ABIE78_004221 [Sinorhizobium fredii]